MSHQQEFRHCSFCERNLSEDVPVGTAQNYIRYEDDREDGIEEVPVCLNCAASTVEGPDENLAEACDLCSHVGYTTNGRRDDGSTDEPIYREATVVSWRVEIVGLEGLLNVCEDCTPIKTVDLLRNRPNRQTVKYGEEP